MVERRRQSTRDFNHQLQFAHPARQSRLLGVCVALAHPVASDRLGFNRHLSIAANWCYTLGSSVPDEGPIAALHDFRFC